MNHRLEQFVRDHREEFDSEEPGKKIWDKIRQEMEPPKEKKTIIIRFTRASLSVAAAVLLVIAAGIWYLGSRHATNGGEIKAPEVAQTKPSGSEPTPATHTPADTVKTAPEKEQLATTAPKENKDHNTQGTEEESLVNEEMVHYARLVEIKQKELKTIEKDEPLLYRQFASDANKLDSVYHSLQQQLPKNPNKEQLLEAMLQNLQLQMGLLNHQLDIIKQINHSKKTAYEKAYKTA